MTDEKEQEAALELACEGVMMSKRKKNLVHALAHHWYCDRACQSEILKREKTSANTLDFLLNSGVLKKYADLYFGETSTLEFRTGKRSTRGRY